MAKGDTRLVGKVCELCRVRKLINQPCSRLRAAWTCSRLVRNGQVEALSFQIGFGNWFGNQEEMIPCLQEQLWLSPRVGANVSPSKSVSCLVLHPIHFTLTLPFILHFIFHACWVHSCTHPCLFCCSNLCSRRPSGVRCVRPGEWVLGGALPPVDCLWSGCLLRCCIS